MQKKKENFRSLRSVTTFALAAAIITGSIYTVAAAVNSQTVISFMQDLMKTDLHTA